VLRPSAVCRRSIAAGPLLTVALAALLCVAPVCAEERSDGEQLPEAKAEAEATDEGAGASRDEDPTVEKITVHGEREPPEPELPDVTAFATVIDASEKTSEMDSVADVLEKTVGVQVRRFGGLGAFSTLSIRGSTPSQVQIYLDGIPMSRAQDEVVDLSTLPVDSAERIEVYRSVVPIAFSVAGPGGVVNIVTRRPGPVPRTMLKASYGSFQTRKVDVERSQRLGRWEYLVYGTYSGSEGDFTFLDDNGTPSDLNPFDDVETTRENNHFNAVDVLSKVGYQLSDRADLQLTNQTFYKDQGVPGIGSNQAQEASFRQLRTLTHLRGEGSGVGLDGLDLRTTGHFIYGQAQFEDLEGEIGVGNQDTDDQSIAVGGDALLTYYWGAHLVPGLLLAGGYEKFQPDDRLDPANAGPDQNRVRTTVAAQSEIYLWNDRLALVPQVRWEWVHDDFSGTLPENAPSVAQPRARTDDFLSPRFGGRLELMPGFDVLGNVSRLFRPPNFGELFGERGVVTGNPELRPEDALNGDVGFRFLRRDLGPVGELRVEYGYFSNDFTDLIALIPVSQGVLTPQNIGKARISGHEVALSVRAWGHLLFAANYTHQDAIDLGDEPDARDKQLPGRPRDQAYFRAEAFGDWARFFYEVNLIGENFRSRGERDLVPSRNIHNIGLTVTPPGTGLGLTFEVKNLTDDQTADFQGFPLPGRSFFGTVRYTFN
jgi:iron complex outermembrane receptor protein